MAIFQVVKRLFIQFCIYDEDTDQTIRLKPILITLISVSVLFLGFLSSLVYFFKFLLVDLESSLFALWQIFALFSPVFTWVVGFCIRKQIQNTFNKIEDIFNASTI